MASTSAERKAKERALKKQQGFVLKTAIWLKAENAEKLEKYKKENNCTDEEAINKLISQALS